MNINQQTLIKLSVGFGFLIGAINVIVGIIIPFHNVLINWIISVIIYFLVLFLAIKKFKDIYSNGYLSIKQSLILGGSVSLGLEVSSLHCFHTSIGSCKLANYSFR